jgi:hypothetical protein
MADFQVTKQLMEFFRKLEPQGADRMFAVGTPEEQGFSGVPVRRATFVNGQLQSVSETAEVRRQTFPASAFEVRGIQEGMFLGSRGSGDESKKGVSGRGWGRRPSSFFSRRVFTHQRPPTRR